MRPEEDKFIERLYLDTFQLLWTYAMSKLNNPALAQEVVQDAFLEAIRNIEKLMSHENPRGWMKNTVKNKVKHAERSFNRYIIRFISLDTDIPFEDAVLASEDAHAPSVFEIIEEIRQTLSADEWDLLRKIALEKVPYKMQQQNSGSRFGLAKSGYSGFERSCVKILRIIFIKRMSAFSFCGNT